MTLDEANRLGFDYKPRTRDKRHSSDCGYQRINATKGECDCGYFKLPDETQRDTPQHSPPPWTIAGQLTAEIKELKSHAERLAEALTLIRAEMDALKRDERNPDKRLSRLGARFDWNLVVYEPLAAWEGAQK